jgi:hypothetical protein
VPFAVVLLLPDPAKAAEFPHSSVGGYGGNDRVTTSDGASCSSYVGSTTRFETGGITDNTGNSTIFGRIVIPLGINPKRLNCSTIYRLEQQRQRLKLRKLEIEVELMEQRLEAGKNPNAKKAGNDW